MIAGVAAVVVAVASAAAATSGAPRILYVGDWSGRWTRTTERVGRLRVRARVVT
jgi:hypothetical protein